MTNNERVNLKKIKTQLELKKSSISNAMHGLKRGEETRRLQLAITKIEESVLWLNHAIEYDSQINKALNTELYA